MRVFGYIIIVFGMLFFLAGVSIEENIRSPWPWIWVAIHIIWIMVSMAVMGIGYLMTRRAN